MNKQLPGFRTTIRDGGLVAVIPEPLTEKLLIIGNALDGPVNTPVRVRSITEAEEIFGPLSYSKGYVDPVTNTQSGKWADNSLVNAMNEALMGGAGHITLVRVGGTLPTLTFSPSGTTLTATAIAPSRIYNGVVVGVTRTSSQTTVTVAQPSEKGGTFSLTVPDASTTIQDLCTMLNSDRRNRCVIFSIPAVSGSALTSTLTANTSGTFSGGTYGTSAPQEDYYQSKAAYYTALTESGGTFENLVDKEFNVCLLAGIYGDDQVDGSTTTTVAQAFAEFLHRASSETLPCHGVIGLRPIGKSTPVELKAYAEDSLLSESNGNYGLAIERRLKFGYFMRNGFSITDESSGQSIDIGRYLSVFAGPDVVLSNKVLGRYATNGAAVYAGFITKTPAQMPTSNKHLTGVGSIVGNFPKSILEQLVQGVGYNESTGFEGGGGYVVVRTNPLRGLPYIIQDNTAAMRTSDYKTLQIFRIVNLAVGVTKAILYPYIGTPSSIEAYNAMRIQLKSELSKLADAGAFVGGDGVGYDIAISSDQVDSTFTRVNVTLKLVPALQIKYILVDVSVSV